MKIKENDTISRAAVLGLIKELGGCDAQDDKSKGWDAACDALYESVKRLVGEKNANERDDIGGLWCPTRGSRQALRTLQTSRCKR